MGIAPDQVTACLVTRGNVPMQPILDSLIFPEVIVWNNAIRDDAKAYGRFLAMKEARNEVCWTQDDDCIIPAATQRALCERYVDGTLLANHDTDHLGQPWAWFGWGTLVQRELPELAFQAWERCGWQRSTDAFQATGCDIIAGTLIPHYVVSLPFQHLDYAFGGDRLCRTEDYPRYKQDTAEQAARLTLPLKLNLGCGIHRLPGFVNLDKETGFFFEDGLPYEDGSVSAITVSHALMFVREEDWPVVFAEFARVLEPGGVLRITEDATDDPRSERYGGHPDAVTLTSDEIVLDHAHMADFDVLVCRADESNDPSLIQQWHGPEPKVFHVEGVKTA